MRDSGAPGLESDPPGFKRSASVAKQQLDAAREAAGEAEVLQSVQDSVEPALFYGLSCLGGADTQTGTGSGLTDIQFPP